MSIVRKKLFHRLLLLAFGFAAMAMLATVANSQIPQSNQAGVSVAQRNQVCAHAPKMSVSPNCTITCVNGWCYPICW